MDCTLATQNNRPQVFENPEFGKVRTLMENDKILFCASDVANALGYSNPRKATSDHCRCVTKRDVPHPQSCEKIISMSFIPEGDVYRLITHSKLPSAEKFESWVFDEVLPSIRKHGAYMTEETIQRTLTDPDYLIQLATVLKEEKAKRLEAEKKAMALETDNSHKKEIIEGLVEDISLSEKRSRISKIIRYRSSSDKIAMRWNVLYEEFGNKYHKNVRLGFERHKNDWKPKLTSVVDYVDRELNMILELYELACKLFESDFKKMIQEWADIILTADDNILEETF